MGDPGSALAVFPERSREAVRRAVDAAADAALKHIGNNGGVRTAEGLASTLSLSLPPPSPAVRGDVSLDAAKEAVHQYLRLKLTAALTGGASAGVPTSPPGHVRSAAPPLSPPHRTSAPQGAALPAVRLDNRMTAPAVSSSSPRGTQSSRVGEDGGGVPSPRQHQFPPRPASPLLDVLHPKSRSRTPPPRERPQPSAIRSGDGDGGSAQATLPAGHSLVSSVVAQVAQREEPPIASPSSPSARRGAPEAPPLRPGSIEALLQRERLPPPLPQFSPVIGSRTVPFTVASAMAAYAPPSRARSPSPVPSSILAARLAGPDPSRPQSPAQRDAIMALARAAAAQEQLQRAVAALSGGGGGGGGDPGAHSMPSAPHSHVGSSTGDSAARNTLHSVGQLLRVQLVKGGPQRGPEPMAMQAPPPAPAPVHIEQAEDETPQPDHAASAHVAAQPPPTEQQPSQVPSEPPAPPAARDTGLPGAVLSQVNAALAQAEARQEHRKQLLQAQQAQQLARQQAPVVLTVAPTAAAEIDGEPEKKHHEPESDGEDGGATSTMHVAIGSSAGGTPGLVMPPAAAAPAGWFSSLLCSTTRAPGGAVVVTPPVKPSASRGCLVRTGCFEPEEERDSAPYYAPPAAPRTAPQPAQVVHATENTAHASVKKNAVLAFAETHAPFSAPPPIFVPVLPVHQPAPQQHHVQQPAPAPAPRAEVEVVPANNAGTADAASIAAAALARARANAAAASVIAAAKATSDVITASTGVPQQNCVPAGAPSQQRPVGQPSAAYARARSPSPLPVPKGPLIPEVAQEVNVFMRAVERAASPRPPSPYQMPSPQTLLQNRRSPSPVPRPPLFAMQQAFPARAATPPPALNPVKPRPVTPTRRPVTPPPPNLDEDVAALMSKVDAANAARRSAFGK